eukprot:SAG31_NODE_2219_length_6158_cov_6.237168_3_plen_171_part_00
MTKTRPRWSVSSIKFITGLFTLITIPTSALRQSAEVQTQTPPHTGHDRCRLTADAAARPAIVKHRQQCDPGRLLHRSSTTPPCPCRSTETGARRRRSTGQTISGLALLCSELFHSITLLLLNSLLLLLPLLLLQQNCVLAVGQRVSASLEPSKVGGALPFASLQRVHLVI